MVVRAPSHVYTFDHLRSFLTDTRARLTAAWGLTLTQETSIKNVRVLPGPFHSLAL